MSMVMNQYLVNEITALSRLTILEETKENQPPDLIKDVEQINTRKRACIRSRGISKGNLEAQKRRRRLNMLQWKMDGVLSFKQNVLHLINDMDLLLLHNTHFCSKLSEIDFLILTPYCETHTADYDAQLAIGIRKTVKFSMVAMKKHFIHIKLTRNGMHVIILDIGHMTKFLSDYIAAFSDEPIVVSGNFCEKPEQKKMEYVIECIQKAGLNLITPTIKMNENDENSLSNYSLSVSCNLLFTNTVKWIRMCNQSNVSNSLPYVQSLLVFKNQATSKQFP